MPGEAAQVIESLASSHRVLVLGGMAVIAHGLSRTTVDADIWLEPLGSIDEWCDAIRHATAPYASRYFFDVSHQRKVEPEELALTIDNAGMVRIGGIDRYLDVFYQPHQLDLEEFDTAWGFATLGLGCARVLDESFLIATKTDTGRKSDLDDVTFLETKLRTEMSARLSVCEAEEARSLFSRYLDHATCEAALKNPDPAVQDMGLAGLRELAADGNPFAIEALKKRT